MHLSQRQQRCVPCGLRKSRAAYEEAYDGLFATLDWLEQRLSRQRYLVGREITEADWRLFPTLVRFDVAYFSIFELHARTLPCAKCRWHGDATLLRYQLLFDRTAVRFVEGHFAS